MTDDPTNQEAMAQNREIKDSGRRRIDLPGSRMWATTKVGSTSEWALYTDHTDRPRPPRRGSLTTRNPDAVLAVLKALQPFVDGETL